MNKTKLKIVRIFTLAVAVLLVSGFSFEELNAKTKRRPLKKTAVKIVNKPDKCIQTLKANNFIAQLTDVIAVEVETGKSKTWDHLIKNIERDNWADRIVILCPNRDVRGRIEKEIAGKNIGKLIVISYDFIENLADLLPE